MARCSGWLWSLLLMSHFAPSHATCSESHHLCWARFTMDEVVIVCPGPSRACVCSLDEESIKHREHRAVKSTELRQPSQSVVASLTFCVSPKGLGLQKALTFGCNPRHGGQHGQHSQKGLDLQNVLTLSSVFEGPCRRAAFVKSPQQGESCQKPAFRHEHRCAL